MHPGELLRDELEARAMKQVELSAAMGVSKTVISEIIHGKRNITPFLALKLEEALGIRAEFWMRYQVSHDLDKIRINNSLRKVELQE